MRHQASSLSALYFWSNNTRMFDSSEPRNAGSIIIWLSYIPLTCCQTSRRRRFSRRDRCGNDARNDEHLGGVGLEHVPGWTSRRAGHARPAEIVRDREGECDRTTVRKPVRMHLGEEAHGDLLDPVAGE